MTEVFEKSQGIQALRLLLSTSRKITKWTSASTNKFTRWDTALQHLARIIVLPESDDSGVEFLQNTIAWRVENDPRIRNSSVDSKERSTSPSEQRSRMRLQETPVKYPLISNKWSSPTPFPSASTGFSVPSPMDPDYQAASDAFNRDTAQLTGDEQTVNTSLVDLITAVAGMLKSRGRVRLDREPFWVLRKKVIGERALLFKARVDGVVMEKNPRNIQGFMEVKCDLRLQKEKRSGCNRVRRWQHLSTRKAATRKQQGLKASYI